MDSGSEEEIDPEEEALKLRMVVLEQEMVVKKREERKWKEEEEQKQREAEEAKRRAAEEQARRAREAAEQEVRDEAVQTVEAAWRSVEARSLKGKRISESRPAVKRKVSARVYCSTCLRRNVECFLVKGGHPNQACVLCFKAHLKCQWGEKGKEKEKESTPQELSQEIAEICDLMPDVGSGEGGNVLKGIQLNGEDPEWEEQFKTLKNWEEWGRLGTGYRHLPKIDPADLERRESDSDLAEVPLDEEMADKGDTLVVGRAWRWSDMMEVDEGLDKETNGGEDEGTNGGEDKETKGEEDRGTSEIEQELVGDEEVRGDVDMEEV
ncbi:hypothetical protein BDM02DRAFT_3191234 [Thelephora ganbajun]|uniref:Uncharacterized protein n=1 Tax=Thelephora ganbajun TaxID=370292 RepID=A0ACB6Z3P7_THEGA|nr:hypothetical protein BDM02DRAFT_3191234 [Thelephora ganbajun]